MRQLTVVTPLLIALFTHAPPAFAAKQHGAYATQGDCDGFPRLALHTAPGLCVGLVAAHLGFARGVAVLGEDVYVTDMGGWRRGAGRLLRLGHGGRDAPALVLAGLDQPNTLAAGPRDTLYVGLAGRVIRVDPRADSPAASVRDVIVGLPVAGRHPLSAIVVAPDGSLFVNVGSASDHCENADGTPPDAKLVCAETRESPPRAAILRVAPAQAAIDAASIKPYASGLRNSMALAVLDSGRLLAAVNARDAISSADPALDDAELPHDLYLRIDDGADYGWPYCYDERRASPEYAQHDCAKAAPPTRLLPAHAAPLGMLRYRGAQLPALEHRLLIGYHGYRPSGHRIVALSIDADGQPTAAPETIVGGWDYAGEGHPLGAPVALAEAGDGSVFITDDRNGSLLRLARALP